MKLSRISAIFCAALLVSSTSVFAAGGTSKTKKTTTKSTTTTTQSNETPAATTHTHHEMGVAHTEGSPRFTVSGPFTLVGGTALFGAYVQALWTVIPNLEIGPETGFSVGSQSSGLTGVASASEWIIPIVATGLYHFDLPDAGSIHPFVGVSLGLAIIHAGISTSIVNPLTGQTIGGGATSTDFDFAAHLGSAFGDERHFFADIRLGVIGSGFQFAPTVGWNF